MKRVPDESFSSYRERRKNEQEKLNKYLKGRVLWPSYEFGTAQRVLMDGKPCYQNNNVIVRVSY